MPTTENTGRCVRRAICPVLAHDWRFRDIAADGRCTAYCRFCGKCEPARLLLRSPPAADTSWSATLTCTPCAPRSARRRPSGPTRRLVRSAGTVPGGWAITYSTFSMTGRYPWPNPHGGCNLMPPSPPPHPAALPDRSGHKRLPSNHR